ncbi:MAG: site-specific integrase [Acidobacteria bacterium]|nr:site-specific integrase [Acidobacteriota bacterium]
MAMPSRYGHLLEDKNVRRWYENVSRGSRTTADVYLRRLGGFLQFHNVSPAQLTKMKERSLYNLLLDTVTAMEKKDFAGGYIASVLKAVKSWLLFNGVEVRRGIRIRGAHETPTLQDERVPSQDELRRILLAGDEKTRAICVLLAHSGLRPEVLGAYRGTDGLRLKDFPELAVEDGTIIFQKIPTIVRVRSSLSKKAHEYFTFLGEEGCEYLKAYLEMRIRGGENLTADSPVICPKTAKKAFITTTNIGDAVRNAIRKAGFPWRPYVLRSFFATQMMLAESTGQIIRDYRSFFMGHKGDIEAVYTVNKRKLPQEVIKQMRASYARAQKYLQTVAARDSTEEMTKAFKKQLLLVAGLKPSEITDEHLGLDDDEFQKLVRERLLKEVSRNQPGQRVVDVAEVEAHLTQGWEFVGLLPNEKAILKQANT